MPCVGSRALVCVVGVCREHVQMHFPGLHSSQGWRCFRCWRVESEHLMKKRFSVVGARWSTFAMVRSRLPRPRTPFNLRSETHCPAMRLQTQARVGGGDVGGGGTAKVRLCGNNLLLCTKKNVLFFKNSIGSFFVHMCIHRRFARAMKQLLPELGIRVLDTEKFPRR